MKRGKTDPVGQVGPSGGSSRRERAKARTRAALVHAAQRLIVDGHTEAAILDITKAADVGLGSFYNHFASRAALFQAATDEALETVGMVLDELSAGLEDPADVFSQAFRLTGRLIRREPSLMQVALSPGPALLRSTRGLVPRAGRDLEAGIRSGRFALRDPEVGLAITLGAALCLEELLRQEPKRKGDLETDAIAAGLLRMLGLDPDEAERISSRPLPRLDLVKRLATSNQSKR